MERRTALKNMTLAGGGMMMLPTWASAWNRSSLSFSPFLSPQQDATLTALVDTIIPTTDIPGAEDLEVHLFVQKMVADCYETVVQENLKQGLEMLDIMARQSYGSTFSTCRSLQRETLLMKLENPPDTENAASSSETEGSAGNEISAEQHEFFFLVKELTIRGFMTSEYVMTHHTDYNMMPGHFYGCVSAIS